jgi:hypothetical protein
MRRNLQQHGRHLGLCRDPYVEAGLIGSIPSLNSGDTPMIRRQLLIATAIIASVVITACSDMTGPQTLVPGGLPAAAQLVPAGSAEASRLCAAPGTGLVGALNMLRDATMFTIPMTHDADQGNAGMFHAVDVSGCSMSASRP